MNAKERKRISNARYYDRTRRRFIFRANELCPSVIDELITCLENQEPHKLDKRIERLRALRETLA